MRVLGCALLVALAAVALATDPGGSPGDSGEAPALIVHCHESMVVRNYTHDHLPGAGKPGCVCKHEVMTLTKDKDGNEICVWPDGKCANWFGNEHWSHAMDQIATQTGHLSPWGIMKGGKCTREILRGHRYSCAVQHADDIEHEFVPCEEACIDGQCVADITKAEL